MATKCIVLGEEPNNGLKPIEFFYALGDEKNVIIAEAKPKNWSNIELITTSYDSYGYDLMYAYDNYRNQGSLYLGKWNDGVV